MDVLFHNQTLFLMTFNTVITGLDSVAYLSAAAELTIISITSLTAAYLIYLKYSIPLFHANLNILNIFQICLYFPNAMARLILILYNLDLLKLEDFHLTIYWCSFLRLFYIIAMIMSSISILSERAFAMYFIKDYEKTRRIYIPILIILSNILISSLVTYLRHKKIIEFIPLVLFALAMQIIGAVMFLIEYIHNKRRSSIMKLKSIYTVSIRYQVNENLRTFQMLRRSVTSIICLIPIVAVAFILRSKVKEEVVRAILGTIIEICMSGFPLIIFISSIFSVKKWRSHILTRLRCTEQNEESLVDRRHNTAKFHFNQLQNSWQ